MGGTKIFGIGLSRTGTMSLASAFEVLGYRTIHYPYDEVTQRELEVGEYRLSVLEDHDAVTDITVAAHYPQLDRAYPGSKFVLTVRDQQGWLRSMQGHFERLPVVYRDDAQFHRFTQFICACVYGSLEFQAERMAYVYDTHLRNVREYFAGRPADLLEMDICAGEGWDVLCGFLGCPVPGTAFPHRNKARPGAGS